MNSKTPYPISGFTLLELVITIALAGFIMMMIVPFFQSGITTSHRPAQWLQDIVTLQKTMENFNGYYGKFSTKDSTTLNTLSTAIGTVGSSYTNTFGTYRVLEKGFICFDAGGAEQTVGCPSDQTNMVLKVTLGSTTNPGNQATQLFTVQVSH